jgi:glycosyltransferase involved in cell wall biosynthesis
MGGYALLAEADWRVAAIPFTQRVGREDFVRSADIVHYQSYFSSFFLASTLLGKQVRRTAQYTGGSISQENSFFRREVGSHLLLRALNGVKAVILDDEDPESRGQSEFLTKVAGLSSERVLSLPTLMVDPDVFKPHDRKESRSLLGIDDSAISVMLVSAVMDEPSSLNELTKNPFRAVRLFSKLTSGSEPDFRLHILGGGSGLPALKDLVGRLAMDRVVCFHGVVKHDQVAAYMAASDLVFVPYNFIELNYGTSVIEAFACWRPVCGFRRVHSSAIDRKGGFLVSPEEESGAKELGMRLHDPAYLERKAAEGFEVAKSHLTGNVARRLESAFLSILKGAA